MRHNQLSGPLLNFAKLPNLLNVWFDTQTGADPLTGTLTALGALSNISAGEPYWRQRRAARPSLWDHMRRGGDGCELRRGSSHRLLQHAELWRCAARAATATGFDGGMLSTVGIETVSLHLSFLGQGLYIAPVCAHVDVNSLTRRRCQRCLFGLFASDVQKKAYSTMRGPMFTCCADVRR
jgi:hypothetical protein